MTTSITIRNFTLNIDDTLSEYSDRIISLVQLLDTTDYFAEQFQNPQVTEITLEIGENGSLYNGIFGLIKFDPQDTESIFVGLDGKPHKLTVERIITHELLHAVAGLDDAGMVGPDASTVALNNLADPNGEFMGDTVRQTNILMQELFGEVGRGHYPNLWNSENLDSTTAETRSILEKSDFTFGNDIDEVFSGGVFLTEEDNDFELPIDTSERKKADGVAATDDLVLGFEAKNTIKTGGGNDFIYSGGGNDYVDAGVGIDYIDGGSGEDTLIGGAEVPILIDEDGNEFFNYKGDIIYGGADNDTIITGSLNVDLESATHEEILQSSASHFNNDFAFGGAGNDKIYSNGGSDFLVGGGDDDKFFALGGSFNEVINGQTYRGDPSLNTFIWGGDGADEFHFYGNVEIGIIYIDGLDELLESDYVNIDLEKLADAASSYFSLVPNYIIINPTAEDKLFQNGERITGGQLEETELKDPDLVPLLEEETGLDANAGRIVEHETESHITTIGGVNYERFDVSTITYTDVEATSYTVYAGGSANEYEVSVLTDTYSGLITNELSMWHEEVTPDDEIRLDVELYGFTNGLFGISYSSNPEESLKVTSSVYDVSNHTEEKKYVHYDTSADPVPAWEYFGDIVTQIPEDTPPEGSVLISEEEGEVKAKLFDDQFFSAQKITFNISNFMKDPNDPDPDNPENPDGIDPITTEGTSEDETQSGGGGHDTLNGAGGDDELNGRGGDDTLNGGEGDDTLNGGNGNDTLYGGEGDDYVYGNDGDDTFIAGTGLGYDEYYGGAGNDTIIFPSTEQGVLVDLSESIAEGVEIDDDYLESIENVVGGSGDDTIIGDDENNILAGAEGDDTLTGGLGEDEFVYNFGDGTDTITDFDYTSDRINLSTTAITFSGILAFAQNQGDNVVIELSSFAGAGSSDRIILNNVTVDQLSESNFVLATATNNAPVLDDALADQSSEEDTAVNFVQPADAFSDADGDMLTLTATLADDSALPAWLSFDADTRTFSGIPPQDFNGALDIKVTASDGELEASDIFTLDITSVNDAPVLENALSDQSSDEDNAVSFVLPADAFSDVDGDTLTLTATLSDDSALPAWLSFDADTRTFSGTPPQDFNGELDIKVVASDGELEASDTFTLDITSVNDAPVLDDALADQSSEEDTAVNFVLPADAFSDVDGDTLTLTATLSDDSALPAWLSFDADTRTFSGTPPQDFNGALDIKVIASDGALEASDTFTLDITSVNDAPVLDNALADQSSDEDTAVNFVLPADAFSDADGDTLTLTASLSDDSVLPAWLSFDADTRTFSGTPPQDFNGSLNIKVIASDGELEASDTFTLDITSVNDAPVLDNALADQSSDEDTAVSFVLPADAFSDADGDALTLSAILADDSALPAWLSFDADTRTFSGTPPQDFNGALDIKVTASDGELEASDTFTLDIASVNDAPVLDNALSDQTSNEDTAVSFVLPADAFSDADGDALTLSASLADDSALPAWLSFDADTRTFSGTPPQDFNGALDIKVTASDGELEASDTFTLDIASVNDAPVLDNALSDQTSNEDTAVSFVLPADAFSDADGDALTLSASLADDSALPAWLSFDADTRTFSGTPPQDFNGALDIKVIASDGSLEASDTFTLDIASVNDAPIAQNDSGFNALNTASLVINASDLLANDSDVDSSNLSISAVTNSSSGGTVEINSDGDIVYTAAEGFSGQDIFQYTITDGEQTSSAFVEVTVSDDASNPYDGWTIGTDDRDYIFGDLFDNNQIYGAGGNDILIGGFYADEIDGGTGRDRIFGLWGDDTLNGNEGNDKIFGGAGADTISGGAGSDKLWGGWGSDTFTFSSGSGRDRIMDFSTGNSWYSYFSGKDKIQIDIEGVDSFDDLAAFASEVNGNTIFDFGNGDELILSNTRLAALDKDAFTFY